MTTETQAILHSQIATLILGALLFFTGLAACLIAAIRSRGGVGILVWFGTFCAAYGARLFAGVPRPVGFLSESLGASVVIVITYLILIPALFFWLELSVDKLRPFIKVWLILATLIGIAAIASFFTTGSAYRFMRYNNLLAIGTLLTLGTIIVVPKLSARFLNIRSRVLAVGTLIVALAALYANLSSILEFRQKDSVEPIAFTIFVFCLGYVALERVFAGERRLLTIENELDIARKIQQSILPESVPQRKNLSIAATYLPMTSVAGDFYDFVEVDHGLGVLVADVSGHGVPAALIASMIKVAMHSITTCAHDPSQVLTRLNSILYPQLKGQFISAAYLWFGAEDHTALYSAAGHPPLLCWRRSKGALQRIESNGLLIGILPTANYPVCDLPLSAGDRILAYTDGLIEPENSSGASFGDTRLEQVFRSNGSHPPSEFSKLLVSELRAWQPASATQGDDITLVVIDVV
jgi:sigma-B regulation protein RsbU (phosphoserine phosphatase)